MSKVIGNENAHLPSGQKSDFTNLYDMSANFPDVSISRVGPNFLQKSSIASPVSSSESKRSVQQALKKSAISFQDEASVRSVDLLGPVTNGNSKMLQPGRETSSKVRFENKYITLTEDGFGTVIDVNQREKPVKRFTWKNHNNIQVQVINYGARITSIKFPDKKGDVGDIVLGFDTLEGYIHHDQYYFGATIGRVTGPVTNSTFVIDGKQYWINSNDGKHHLNGGFFGLDKVIWKSTVNENKVIFSHILPNGHEGFVGELLVQITFELSSKNEFRINMEGKCTAPTIINLSNLCYFNLAGHDGNIDEIRKHFITINSSSYTVNGNNNLPNGKIEKTAFTRFDFQIPVLLKNYITTDISPNTGFDQTFCVNKDENEEISFVARALHVPSGRTLEIYSNQYGVRFTTSNNFGASTSSLLKSALMNVGSKYDYLFKVYSYSAVEDKQQEKFILLVDVYQKLKSLEFVNEDNFKEVLDLLQKLYACNLDDIKSHLFATDLFQEANIDFKFFMTAIIHAIDVVKHSIPSNIERIEKWTELKNIIDNITAVFNKLNQPVMTFTQQVNVNFSQIRGMSTEQIDNTLKELEQDLKKSINNSQSGNLPTYGVSMDNSEVTWLWEELLDRVVRSVLLRQVQPEGSARSPSISIDRQRSVQSDKIVGKKGFVYRKHTGIAFQTQNYPNAVHHENFPNCVLRPNETYKHKIIYKFWVQSGNPKKWAKRYETL